MSNGTLISIRWHIFVSLFHITTSGLLYSTLLVVLIGMFRQISLFPITGTDSGRFWYVDSLFSCLTISSTMCCLTLSCLAVVYRFDERLGQDPRACSTVSSCESQRRHLVLIVGSFSLRFQVAFVAISCSCMAFMQPSTCEDMPLCSH